MHNRTYGEMMSVKNDWKIETNSSLHDFPDFLERWESQGMGRQLNGSESKGKFSWGQKAKEMSLLEIPDSIEMGENAERGD
jgi:hypothetical protein